MNIEAKLVEIKYFEPAKKTPGHEYRLHSIYTHPNRFRYVNCWLEGDIRGVSKVCRVGAEGWFEFREGKCSNFWGEFEAEIVSEISEDRLGDNTVRLTTKQPMKRGQR